MKLPKSFLTVNLSEWHAREAGGEKDDDDEVGESDANDS